LNAVSFAYLYCLVVATGYKEHGPTNPLTCQ